MKIATEALGKDAQKALAFLKITGASAKPSPSHMASVAMATQLSIAQCRTALEILCIAEKAKELPGNRFVYLQPNDRKWVTVEKV